MPDIENLNQRYMDDATVQKLVNAGAITDKNDWKTQLTLYTDHGDCLESGSVQITDGLKGDVDLQTKFCAPVPPILSPYGGGRRRRRRRRKSRKSRRKSRKTKRKRRKSRKTKRKRRKSRK